MNPSLGRITARLAEPDEAKVGGLIQLLNINIDPPNPLSEGDVYIRAMYIVSDEVNSYGGCFTSEEHARMCELLIDSPVMVGHRKDKLPIGRNFHAVQVEKDGRRWIKSYFYWLKNAEGATNLRDNIDGGIYKECSVGFTFRLPECSICGKDIRLCPHEPFEKYQTADGETVCHFNYRRIERVLETSLVYRGAIPDTSVSRELKADDGNRESCAFHLAPLDGPEGLEAGKQYLVIPRYESIPVRVEMRDGELSLEREDSCRIADDIAAKFPIEGLPETLSAQGRLVGYRGKERCQVEDVEAFLEGKTGPVSRLVVFLLPGGGVDGTMTGDNHRPYDVRVIPHRAVDQEGLNRRAREIATKLGVEVWAIDTSAGEKQGYCYEPKDTAREKKPESALCWENGSDRAVLRLQVNKSEIRFAIERFNAVLLLKGRRFVAGLETETEADDADTSSILEVPVERVTVHQSGLTIRLGGDLRGEYAIRPIIARGTSKYLFYRSRREGR